MKFPKKLFEWYINYSYKSWLKFNNSINRSTKHLSQLRLVDENICIEDVTRKAYFIISCNTSFATDKLYADEWLINETMYEDKFSKKDYGTIKHLMGGLKAFELGSFYTLKSINHENKNITVINKQTLKTENWELSAASNFERYSQLDKQSIFQLACFYSEQQILFKIATTSTNKKDPDYVDDKDAIYISEKPKLKLVK